MEVQKLGRTSPHPGPLLTPRQGHLEGSMLWGRGSRCPAWPTSGGGGPGVLLADNRGSGDVRQQSGTGTRGCSELESRRVTGGESSSNGTLLFKGLDGQPRPNGDSGADRTAYFPLAPWSAVWRGGWQCFCLLLLGPMSRFAVLSPFPPRGEQGRGSCRGRWRPPHLQALGAGAPWGPGGHGRGHGESVSSRLQAAFR